MRQRTGTIPTTSSRRPLVPVILAVLCLLPGCDSEPPQPPGVDVPTPADRSRFEPETLAAFDAATDRVRHVPNASNWSELGRLYDAHQQLDDAIACYRAAIDAGDRTNRTAHLLALSLDESGDRQAALAAMQRASAQAPNHGPTFWRLAQWQLEAGDPAAAERSMKTAVQIGPQDPATLQAFSKFLIETSQPEEAINPLILLLREEPSNSYARYLLGTALIQTGREADGQAQLELGRGGKPVWRDRHVDELGMLSTGPRADFLRLQMICDGGNPQAALPKLLLLEERLREDPSYHVQVAKAYRMLNNLETARTSLDSALALSPEHFSANYQLAGLLRDQWHARPVKDDTTLLESALVQADLVLTLNDSLADSHAVRGQILDDLDRPDEAAQAFQRADSLDSQNQGFGYLAAKVYMTRQQWDKAVVLLAQQYNRYPQDWPLRRELGLAQWKAGHVADAQETLLPVQQKFPDDQAVAGALRDLQQR